MCEVTAYLGEGILAGALLQRRKRTDLKEASFMKFRLQSGAGSMKLAGTSKLRTCAWATCPRRETLRSQRWGLASRPLQCWGTSSL